MVLPLVDKPVVGAAFCLEAAVCLETSGATCDAEGKTSIANKNKAAPTDKARLRSDAVVSGDATRDDAACEVPFSSD